MISDDDFVKLFQKRAGLTPDGYAGNATLAKLDELFPVPANTFDLQDVPNDYWPMLSKIESNDKPYIKAATSSASGLYQFIKATWLGEGGTWGTNTSLAFGGLLPSTNEQLDRAKTFTARNVSYLRNKNIPINKASLYAAHFFGPVIAARIISANVSDRADHIAGEAATKANRWILAGKTVGEFLSWLHKKTGDWAR